MAHTNAVDGHYVPVPQISIIRGWEEGKALADRLQTRETKFVIEPNIRFKGQVGEQATMFLFDPMRRRPGIQGSQGHVPAVYQVAPSGSGRS